MTSEERAGHNQTIFRAANEAIEARLAGAATPMTFLCECGNESCRETIELTYDEYEGVRSDASCFAIVDGHEGTGEAVLDRSDRFTLVQKTGAARGVAEARNPRRS